ncbi:MAG: hypothetical protein IJP24_03855 [Firmicutes bacterium]|nr:hypothetical protein [Bacillota bacterium]
MAQCCDNMNISGNRRISKKTSNNAGGNGTFKTLPREEMTEVVTTYGNWWDAPAIDVNPGFIPGSDAPLEPAPEIIPGSPSFQVPENPLLPPGYSETLNYDALQYLNGFYRTQIGRYVRVEQQVNSTDVEIRYGYLIGVGINYLLLQDASTGNVFTIDSYSIKLFYVYYNIEGPFGQNSPLNI